MENENESCLHCDDEKSTTTKNDDALEKPYLNNKEKNNHSNSEDRLGYC